MSHASLFRTPPLDLRAQRHCRGQHGGVPADLLITGVGLHQQFAGEHSQRHWKGGGGEAVEDPLAFPGGFQITALKMYSVLVEDLRTAQKLRRRTSRRILLGPVYPKGL